jgi:hypothetical protein
MTYGIQWVNLSFFVMTLISCKARMYKCSPYCLVLFCLMLIHSTLAGQEDFVPCGFVENKGQIRDQSGNPNHHVLAAYFGKTLDFLINENGFSYQLKTVYRPANSGSDAAGVEMKMHRVDVILENANMVHVTEFSGALPGTDQHYTEFGTFSEIHHYNRVAFYEIYPGIDLEFVIDQNAGYPVKFNFILQSGARISDIQLRYNGQDAFGLVDSDLKSGADISLLTSLGELKENIPLSYWQNEIGPVEAKVYYEIRGTNTIGYKLDSDTDMRSGAVLVIDPTPSVNWSTYFGGAGSEQANAVRLDGVGFVYFGGSTNSSSGIATAGAHQTTFGGGAVNDMFIAKFDLNGNRIWTTYLGGAGDDQLYGLTSDASANIYFTGSAGSTSGIATPGAYQSTNAGQTDVVVGKVNTAGIMQWCTYLGGSLNDAGNAIDYNAGGICVVGTAVSTSGIATAGAYQTTYGGGGFDGMICRFTDAGALSWSTYFGGTGNDILRAVEYNAAGDVILAGYTSSTSGLTTAGVHQTANMGSNDGIVARFTNTGTRSWCSYFGGNVSDLCLGLGINSSDEIVLTGYTYSSNGIATAGAYDVSFGGAADAYIQVFNNTGNRLWGTYFGGSGNDMAYALYIDPVDNIFISGNTSSAAIATSGAQQVTYGGGSADGFFAQFNTAGTLNWATYLGGSGDDYLRAVTVDVLSGAYAVGFSNSASGISTPGAHQSAIASASQDAVLVKYNSLSALPLMILSFSATPSEQDNAVDCRWKVASENGCDGYLLEKCTDGIQWSVVYESACDPYSALYGYFAQDNDPFSGITYYRISQRDHQNNVIDSRTAVVLLQQDESDILLYPVPAGDYLNLMINRNDDQFCMLNVYDMQGKKLISKPISFIPGANYIGIETAALPEGQYSLQIINPDGSFVQKRFTK